MSAATAGDPPERVDFNAHAATRDATARRQRASAPTTTPSSDTTDGTVTSTSSGDTDGSDPSATGTPNSETSSERSRLSTRHWDEPDGPMSFAAQANQVATAILNGEIEIEVARTYASVARTVAQAMNTEVNRARLYETIPDLELRRGPR